MAKINGWMNIPDPFANAAFAAGGWDSITLDAQHGLFDERALIDTLRALSATTPKRLVRVAWNEPALVGKALDFGADGVIVPLINSVEEARRLADAARYPPRGSRSFGPGQAALRTPGVPYYDLAETIEVWAMIETAQALAAVREIAAVPGIDGLFIGPNDLALSMGLASGSNREEPQILAAFETILAAGREAGKMCGVFCTNGPYAARMAAMGFDMVTAGVDSALMTDAAAARVAEVRG
jgi:4-hydroxy-2-oxoheptanedioate aldolase